MYYLISSGCFIEIFFSRERVKGETLANHNFFSMKLVLLSLFAAICIEFDTATHDQPLLYPVHHRSITSGSTSTVVQMVIRRLTLFLG